MHLQYGSLQFRIKLESLAYLYSRHVWHPFRHLDKMKEHKAFSNTKTQSAFFLQFDFFKVIFLLCCSTYELCAKIIYRIELHYDNYKSSGKFMYKADLA